MKIKCVLDYNCTLEVRKNFLSCMFVHLNEWNYLPESVVSVHVSIGFTRPLMYFNVCNRTSFSHFWHRGFAGCRVIDEDIFILPDHFPSNLQSMATNHTVSY